MIQYYLRPNMVTPDPNDRRAVVRCNRTLYLPDIVEIGAKRGTSFTATDLLGAYNLVADVTSDEVAGGARVVLPLSVITPTIRGVFTSASDSFDPSRHIVRASVAPGTLLIEKMRDAKVEKLLEGAPGPQIIEYNDVNSDTINSKLTPGGIGILTGDDLKFNPDNDAEGIWFIPQSGGEGIKVTLIANRTNGKLIFGVPNELTPGAYIVEVRKGYGMSGAIRVGRLDETLEVN